MNSKPFCDLNIFFFFSYWMWTKIDAGIQNKGRGLKRWSRQKIGRRARPPKKKGVVKRGENGNSTQKEKKKLTLRHKTRTEREKKRRGKNKRTQQIQNETQFFVFFMCVHRSLLIVQSSMFNVQCSVLQCITCAPFLFSVRMKTWNNNKTVADSAVVAAAAFALHIVPHNSIQFRMRNVEQMWIFIWYITVLNMLLNLENFYIIYMEFFVGPFIIAF